MFCEKQRQSGRSMTEMLMVLGIMGVLSIVIVVGLRYALTKTEATKIVDDARKRLLAVSTTPHPRVGNIVLTGFRDTSSQDITITQGFDEQITPYVYIKNVPFQLCRMMTSIAMEKEIVLTVNPNTDRQECVEGDKNILNFGEGVGGIARFAAYDPDDPDELYEPVGSQAANPQAGLNGGCRNNGDCPGLTPICDTSIHQCVECLTDHDCSDARPICDLSIHQCAECLADNDCPDERPVCDTDHNHCIECLVHADCGETDEGWHCLNQSCAQCGGETPIYNPTTGECETDDSCTTDEDCLPYAPDTPVCGINKTCVSCADKNNATPVWNTVLSACEACPTWEAQQWNTFPTSFSTNITSSTTAILTDAHSNQYSIQSSSSLGSDAGPWCILTGGCSFYPSQSTGTVTITALNDTRIRFNSIAIPNGGPGANRYYTSISVDVTENGTDWNNLGTYNNVCSSKETCQDTVQTFNSNGITPYKAIRINLLGSTGSAGTPAVRLTQINGEITATTNKNFVYNNQDQTCVQCLSDSDCANTITPECNINTYTCVKKTCTQDSDCGNTTDGWHCDNGECKSCPTWTAEHWVPWTQPVFSAPNTCTANGTQLPSCGIVSANTFSDSNFPWCAMDGLDGISGTDRHQWSTPPATSGTWSWHLPETIRVTGLTFMNPYSGGNGRTKDAQFFTSSSMQQPIGNAFTAVNATNGETIVSGIPASGIMTDEIFLNITSSYGEYVGMGELVITADTLQDMNRALIWYEPTQRCVQCLSDSDCADSTTPVCHLSTHTCVAN